ncbi:hypothetical protein [Scytonema sp. HK-05]|nr:hypothetical protein [Scytonema sp. HK-05]
MANAERSKTVMRTGESSQSSAGFPRPGNWLSRWGERFEMVSQY